VPAQGPGKRALGIFYWKKIVRCVNPRLGMSGAVPPQFCMPYVMTRDINFIVER